jgi:serine O-acetyltransferase
VSLLDALRLQRLAHALHEAHVPVLPHALFSLGRMLHKAWLPPSCVIEEGATLGYGGNGVVVHPGARVARGSMLCQGVVLDGAVVVEEDVLVGAGAVVVGAVRLGRGSQVGANALVLEDVPAGTKVAGIPARPVVSNTPVVK